MARGWGCRWCGSLAKRCGGGALLIHLPILRRRKSKLFREQAVEGLAYGDATVDGYCLDREVGVLAKERGSIVETHVVDVTVERLAREDHEQ